MNIPDCWADREGRAVGTAPVSIIIRAYNEEDHIGKLLRGIKAQRVQPQEVILVDSGSTDGTVPIAERHGARVVHIAKEDFTFGRALNIGCEAARGEMLVFVSAHVYPVYDTWLERLIEPFTNPRVVLCYGRQQGGVTNKFSEHCLFARWFPGERASPQQGYFCNNANCAVRRSAWEALRYDEMLTGLEDLDWAKRAQSGGGWLVYEPEATIAHVHDETWLQVRNRYRREAMALRRIDAEAHFSFLDFLRLFAANIVVDAAAAMKQKAFVREWFSILRFRFNQFFGAWQGHRDPSEVSQELKQRFYFPARTLHHPPAEAHEARRIDYAHVHPQKTDELA
ncbi:glycosyltransferase [Rhizorhapis sp. SPR117]|uniref:glycosyltransferase n=1 Tax=Rhizorhapis sp. SPR117 TaxID=2912611 RepID=UPI001F3809FB|nr:glycosyltransferase family 2 protein [Rhizorhapis sp. SPR117]